MKKMRGLSCQQAKSFKNIHMIWNHLSLAGKEQ